MKLSSFLVALIVVLTATASGQRVAMDCTSARLWLGMPKAGALNALHEAGYDSYPDLDGKNGVLGFKNSLEKEYCRVAFTAGRLQYVSRFWGKGESRVDTVAAIIDALNSVTEERNQLCRVFPSHKDTPSTHSKHVDISCGERTLSITAGALETGPFYDLSESIGAYPMKQ